MEAIISLDKNKTSEELKYRTGVVSYVSWERLKPYMANAVRTNAENIEGVKIDDDGIQIFLKEY